MSWTADVNDLADKTKKDTELLVDSLSPSQIKTDGFTVRSGSKLLKLQVVEESDLGNIEEEIREEFRKKLTNQSMLIKEKINEKLTELTSMVSVIKSDYEKKEAELKKRMNSSQIMPDITWEHAERGLSVVKGQRADEYIWFVQGIYGPKFVNMEPIEIRYSKKMITNVVFMITTNNDKVSGISTRKPIGLGYFNHYHQNRPDCWGSWKWKSEWKTPDDIIKLAREAEAVLENIYPNSIVTSSPLGLPRLSTLRKHLIKPEVEQKIFVPSQSDSRTGIVPNVRESEDMWMT